MQHQYRRRNKRPTSKKKRFAETIDVSKFIKKAVDSAPVQAPTIEHTFSDFGFSEQVNQNLAKKKYITPSPIQDRAIPIVASGQDVIGLANTGTGKTAAFLLPLIDKMIADPMQRVLVIAPTRELAVQIDDEFRAFAANTGLHSAVCVGGVGIHKQIYNLKRKPEVVIGTPGRLMDLAGQKFIKFHTFNNVVLDEVDRMLDMGFIEPITDMLSKVAPDSQRLFFSATLPPRIQTLSKQFLNNPVTVEIRSGVTTDSVEQDIIRVKDRSAKFGQLCQLLKKPELSKVLIFSETKRDVERLAVDLIKGGFRAESIHGDKRQSQRQRALTQFRTNRVNILVATDVAARGLDIKDVSHVINYTIPQTHDDYVHRIGRTGRGSSKGMAYTFVE